MSVAKSPAVVCQICKQPKSPQNGTIGEVVRPSLSDFIKKKDPQWDGKGFICFEDLGKFRRDYVKEVLEDEIGELSTLDQEVVESLQAHEILSSDISKQADLRGAAFRHDRGLWRKLDFHHLLQRSAGSLDRDQQLRPDDASIRSIPVHLDEFGSLRARGLTGTGHHDEPEPERSTGPVAW